MSPTNGVNIVSEVHARVVFGAAKTNLAKSGVEMAVPEAATTAGDEWHANEPMRQSQISEAQAVPKAPASAAGSVVVNDVDDDAAFGPGGPLETEDYASARASFEEHRSRTRRRGQSPRSAFGRSRPGRCLSVD